MFDTRRVLVLANETVAGQAVLDEVRYRGGPRAQVLVVSPVLVKSRLGHLLGTARDAALDQARDRLNASVAAMVEAGLDAEGHLSDSDPHQALDDGIRMFRPDEVIVSTHPPARSTWLENQVVARAREAYEIPVHHVVVDTVHEAETVQRDDGRARPSIRKPPPEKVVLYRTSEYDEALAVRDAGFANRSASGRSGVPFSTTPPPHDTESLVFMVEIPAHLVSEYEVTSEGDGQTYVLPADLVNRHIPQVVSSDFSE